MRFLSTPRGKIYFYLSCFLLFLCLGFLVTFKVSFITLVISLCIYFFYRLVKNPQQLVLFFLILLPLNTLLNIVAYHFLHIKGAYLDILKMWKDILLIMALCYWIIINFKEKKLSDIKNINKWILYSLLSFFVLEFIYFILPIGPAGISERLYALRTDTTYLFMFLLGLLLPVIKLDLKKIMKSVLIIAIVFSIISVFERFISPIQLLIWLGMPDYTLYMNGSLPLTQGGLPYTYWAHGGIRRVGSLLLNPLDLASFSAFAFPTIFVIKDTRKRIIAGLLLFLSVLFTLGRMDIIIMILEVALLIAWKYPRTKKILLYSAGGALVILVGIVLSLSKLRTFMFNTITFKEPSAQGHLHEWNLAITQLLQHPFGLGLATSGSAGARSGHLFGGEDQYLIVGVELGWLGVLIFVSVIVCISIYLYKEVKRTRDVSALWVLTIILFLAVSGLTQQSFLNITLTYISFLVLGILVKGKGKVIYD